MTKILVAYGTTEGQTAKIADQLAEMIRVRRGDHRRLNPYGQASRRDRRLRYTNWDRVSRFAEDFVLPLISEDTAQQKG
jgi:menaquinone-dependent protoporphyrinogen IX oxidase